MELKRDTMEDEGGGGGGVEMEKVTGERLYL